MSEWTFAAGGPVTANDSHDQLRICNTVCRVVHLDLKSSNVLLAADGTAKISDVGLAALISRSYLSQMAPAGTWAWVAPEVILGGRVTHKADIFSFGVVLWEIVTLERPAWRGNLRDIRCARPKHPHPEMSSSLLVTSAMHPCKTLDHVICCSPVLASCFGYCVPCPFPRMPPAGEAFTALLSRGLPRFLAHLSAACDKLKTSTHCRRPRFDCLTIVPPSSSWASVEFSERVCGCGGYAGCRKRPRRK